VDERTNSLGLFNFAEAYRLSAIALQLENIAHGHAHTPVRMLYHHAIELYLKALLRQRYSVTVLTNRFRHDIKRMTQRGRKARTNANGRRSRSIQRFDRNERHRRSAVYHHRIENVRHVRGAQSNMRQSPGRRRPHPTQKWCDDSPVVELTRDEARRIAANIAKLPDLLRKA
jgi:hypothetical protein